MTTVQRRIVLPMRAPSGWKSRISEAGSAASACQRLRRDGLHELFARPAESALARAVHPHGRLEVRLCEVGPEERSEHEFRVGRLEEEEVAHACLTGRADHEIGIRQVPGIKEAGKGFPGSVAG